MADVKRKAKPRESVPRLSITLTPKLKSKIQLASALADMEPGEWCKTVLVQAAKMSLEKVGIQP